MGMLRCGDSMFEKFGQVYVTTCYPDVVKAWHYHQNQADNMVVVKDMKSPSMIPGKIPQLEE